MWEPPVKEIEGGWQVKEVVCKNCEVELWAWPDAAELVKQDGEVYYVIRILRGKSAVAVYRVYNDRNELMYTSVAIFFATEKAVHRSTWTIGPQTVHREKEHIEFYMWFAADELRMAGVEGWEEAFLTWAEPARELGIAPEKILEGLKNAPVCLPELAKALG
jgi:hypothetical protein